MTIGHLATLALLSAGQREFVDRAFGPNGFKVVVYVTTTGIVLKATETGPDFSGSLFAWPDNIERSDEDSKAFLDSLELIDRFRVSSISDITRNLILLLRV
jgi:hypothetical protein